MWKVVDEARKQLRAKEVHAHDQLIKVKLHLESLCTWKAELNFEAFQSNGGQIARSALISWLFHECTTRHIHPSVSCLAVNYLDRVLSKACVSIEIAESLAVVCIRLAIKMDGTGGDAMKLPSFVQHQPPLHLELFVLKLLDWQLNVPTVYAFLNLFADYIWLPPPSRQRAFEYVKRISLCKFKLDNSFLCST